MSNDIEVIGPEQFGIFLNFGVVRQFVSIRTGLPFELRFKISFEERSGKWHHGSFSGEQDGLCYERLYAPSKDCTCIKACQEKLENFLGKK